MQSNECYNLLILIKLTKSDTLDGRLSESNVVHKDAVFSSAYCADIAAHGVCSLTKRASRGGRAEHEREPC